jgi:hypothetical protein
MTYGEAATQTVKGLAAQPALLLIAVLNVIMLFGVGYIAVAQVDERRAFGRQQHDLLKAVLDECRPTAPSP